MKPTPPEDRELEEMSAEVSEHYRAAGQEEPPPRLDAAVRMAARREMAQPQRPRRNWQVPASIAAVLVLGVSLLLVVHENEPPLPSMKQPAAGESQLAKSAPPQPAMKRKPQATERSDPQRERPSRERSARPDREASVADELAPAPEQTTGDAAPEKARENMAPSLPKRAAGQAQNADSAAVPAQAPPAPPAALEQKQAPMADSRSAGNQKFEGFTAPGAQVQRAPREEQEARARQAPAKAEEWLRRIDALLAQGEEARARTQLLDFRKQYPHYALPPRLQVLLP